MEAVHLDSRTRLEIQTHRASKIYHRMTARYQRHSGEGTGTHLAVLERHLSSNWHRRRRHYPGGSATKFMTLTLWHYSPDVRWQPPIQRSRCRLTLKIDADAEALRGHPLRSAWCCWLKIPSWPEQFASCASNFDFVDVADETDGTSSAQRLRVQRASPERDAGKRRHPATARPVASLFCVRDSGTPVREMLDQLHPVPACDSDPAERHPVGVVADVHCMVLSTTSGTGRVSPKGCGRWNRLQQSAGGRKSWIPRRRTPSAAARWTRRFRHRQLYRLFRTLGNQRSG